MGVGLGVSYPQGSEYSISIIPEQKPYVKGDAISGSKKRVFCGLLMIFFADVL